MALASIDSDSRGEGGGYLPGARGVPAFFCLHGEPSAIPILISAPHAGRHYPPALIAELRHGASATLRLEDRRIDMVARAVAQRTGAGLVVANAPRAMIDLNRAPEDIDWDMFVKDARPVQGRAAPSRRARGGLGLIPRRLPAFGELWRRRFGAKDLDDRMAGVHEPYHAALSDRLSALRERWGAALLIDLHSMPPLPERDGASVQIVVGDRFGASSEGSVVAATFAHLAQVGREAAHNRPYAGGYILDRHADPSKGIHAMQLEIDRSAYLDAAMVEPGPGLDEVVEDLCGLVRRLAALVTEMGRDAQAWPLAAE